MLGKLNEARKNTEKFHGNQHTSPSESGDDQNGSTKSGGRTGDKIAKEYGIGYGTVQRAEHFAKGLDEAEKVSPGIREKVLSGEVKAPKSAIAEIRKMPEEEKAVQNLHSKCVNTPCFFCEDVLL